MNKFSTVLSFLILVVFTANAQVKQMKTWEVFELGLKASARFQNPYVETIREGEAPYASAQFTGTSGEALNKKINVAAFWDGESNWKIRFTPTVSGTWKYETFSKDKGLNKKKGTLEVNGWSQDELKANATRRGFIQVNKEGPRAGRYFVYNDGTPCLWISDTWWDWTNRRIKWESMKELVDTRSEQGFNIGQLFFAGNGWGGESSLLDKTWQNPDIAQIQKVEKMIAYANSKGITVWIHPWWSRKDIVKTIGAENMRRWWRYVIHRLHAYNVIWVLAGEYNMDNNGGFPLQFWNDLGELIKKEDPYDRIVGAHPTPPTWGSGMEAPQWSTATVLHDQKWLDYNQSQPGHHPWTNEYTPEIIKTAYDKQPAKPIVVTEPWYEFIEDNPTAMEVRFGAWSAIMSGAAGHTYGGGHVWLAYLPEKAGGGGQWPVDRTFDKNTMLYPGALSMSFMSKYLNSFKWWELAPHPELVIQNPSRYCIANPGKEYLVYLRYGGNFKLDLSAFSANDNYNYEWVDLVENKVARKNKVAGGKVFEFKCPSDYPGSLVRKDWLVRVYKE